MNNLVIQQSVREIEQIRTQKFLNWQARKLITDQKNLHFLFESYKPHFSVDPSRGVWGGATVTFVAMQLAYYMGFDQVILIGVDHNFVAKGTPHQVVVAKETDPDHFHSKYFADGTRWQLPDLRTSEYAYELANEAFRAVGREILDATMGGKLDIFPKVNFYDLFDV